MFLFRDLKPLTHLVADGYYLVAHIFAKHCDVCLLLIQTKLCLKPFIRLFFCHYAALPNSIECSMGKNAAVAELTVGESSHRALAISMRTYVGITLRISVTDEQIAFLIDRVLLVNNACRSKLRLSSAVWTVYFIFLFHSYVETPPIVYCTSSISGIRLFLYSR